MIRGSTIERVRAGRAAAAQPAPPDPDIADRVIGIVGECIPNLAFPVRSIARLRQDLGLTDADRLRIERRVEEVFGVPAHGVGPSWHQVIDVARFVSVRLRRQRFLETGASRDGSRDAAAVAFRKIAPHSPLPWRVGEDQHGGNAVIYDALGAELAVVGPWGGLTDLEAGGVATAIVTAVNAMGGVTPAEEDRARAATEGESF